MGQTKPVFVYKLIVEEGLEQAIEILKARKAALAAALFAGAAKSELDLRGRRLGSLRSTRSPAEPSRGMM